MSERQEQVRQTSQKPDFSVVPNAMSNVKRVIGVMSGKGGVGKSLVTAMLATLMNRRGYRTAVLLDADITGPSIPKIFGVEQNKAEAIEQGIVPVRTKSGIAVMSINFLLENPTDPVVWRGPLIAGAIRQFWSDVVWGNVNYMFVDLPPGTGDAPLTIFQSLPVNGIVIVTSPQALVSMIVSKAVKMAQMMNVPIIGVVENMSYFTCPDCGKQTNIFGESHIQDAAAKYGIDLVSRLPLDPRISALTDQGLIEEFDEDWLTVFADRLEVMEG